MLTLAIEHSWDGRELPPEEHATLRVAREGDVLVVQVAAPYYGDPAPTAPPGVTDRLWEHEVVELFVAGPDERYLELELGPHGHHLALCFDGVRRPTQSGLPVDYRVDPRVAGGAPASRFAGTARVAARYLPRGPLRANAYAIHGHACFGGAERCHHAHAAVPGAHPDFHRLECFVPVVLD